MKRTIQSALTVIVILAGFLMSCSLERPKREGLGDLSILLGFESKTLSVSSEDPPLDYHYYISQGEDAPSDYSLWPSLVLQDGVGTVRNVRPGFVRVDIVCLSGSKPVYTGSGELQIREGTENSVTVFLHRVQSDGKGLLSVRVTSTCDSLDVSYRRVGDESFSFLACRKDGSVFSCEKELESACYELRLVGFRNSVQVAGEIAAFEVPTGGRATVTGSVSEGLEINDGFDISGSSTCLLKVGQSKCFYLPSDGMVRSYSWYLDGKLVSTSAVFNFNAGSGGKHTVRCITGEDDMTIDLTCYYHESMSLTMTDVLNTFRNASVAFSSITRNGEDLLSDSSYPIVLEYTPFEYFYDISQIGAVAQSVSLSNLSSCETLVIGKNVPLLVTSDKGWVGQGFTTYSNTALKKVFTFRPIESRAFYGCANLNYLWCGDTVTSIGSKGLGGTSISRFNYKNRIVFNGETVFDNSAFEK